ncbi:hypothetical protein [Pseudobutyrivibrio sp.]|uniref:hypothetical protein n=1 Tax=Pseudobutyrivibrio sp. TaxID=2014367 RepID=UPI0025DF44EE|nr:hypothetical protein [Pseudobutyrivibrio sp.]
MALNNSPNTDNNQQNTRPNVVQHPLQNSNIRPRLSTTPGRPLTLEQKIKGQQRSKAYKNYRQNQMSEHNNQDRAETEPIPRTPPIPHSPEGHPVPLAPTAPEVPFIPETRLHVVNNPDPIDVDTARIGQSRYSQLRNQSQYQSRPPMGPRMPENQPNWQPKTEAPNIKSTSTQKFYHTSPTDQINNAETYSQRNPDARNTTTNTNRHPQRQTNLTRNDSQRSNTSVRSM